jgi:hypothetical protein
MVHLAARTRLCALAERSVSLRYWMPESVRVAVPPQGTAAAALWSDIVKIFVLATVLISEALVLKSL